MSAPKPPKFTVAHAEVDAARDRLRKYVTKMFLPTATPADEAPPAAQRCPRCGYWVQGACSTCTEED